MEGTYSPMVAIKYLFEAIRRRSIYFALTLPLLGGPHARSQDTSQPSSDPTLPWLDYKSVDPVLLASTFASGAEQPGPAVSDQKAPPNPEKKSPSAEKALYPYRWENGLDLLLSNLFGKSAFDLESPSLVGEALWSYKFKTGTSLGGILLGSLQPMAVKRNNAKLSFTLYHFGPYISQDLWRYEHYRLLASLALGRGFLFVRRSPDGSKPTMHRNEYQFIEPGISFIFYQTRTLDIGVVANYRSITLADPVVASQVDPLNPAAEPQILTIATEDDFKGMGFGVTLRATHL